MCACKASCMLPLMQQQGRFLEKLTLYWVPCFCTCTLICRCCIQWRQAACYSSCIMHLRPLLWGPAPTCTASQTTTTIASQSTCPFCCGP
jgi:hypothetical protein